MPTILFVDDSAVDRKLFGRLLEKDGQYQVEYAEHGAAALEQMHKALPDLVLTDMQMPELDGLQLVNAIRHLYPSVPVILMTGHGSEELATRALWRGAASYVPKSLGKDHLLETVRRVLDLSRAEGDYDKLVGCCTTVELNLELENDPSLIDPLVGHAQQVVSGMGICDMSERLQVGIALKEGLLNAIYHGNLELTADDIPPTPDSHREGQVAISPAQRRMFEAPYRNRKVSVSVRISRDEAEFTIQDQGRGFDVKELATVGISKTSEKISGRGLFLMWAFMDRVTFNRTGNKVTMTKRRRPADDQGPAGTDQSVAVGSTVAKKTSAETMGELVPIDGGNPIPLPKSRVIVGSDESCDVVLHSAPASPCHCLLYIYRGWWYVKDLDRRRTIRVDGAEVKQHRLSPGATLEIADQSFEIDYDPLSLGANPDRPPPELL